jgi:hypothetical protein
MLNARTAVSSIDEIITHLRAKYSDELGTPSRHGAFVTLEGGQQVWAPSSQDVNKLVGFVIKKQMQYMKEHPKLRTADSEDTHSGHKDELQPVIQPVVANTPTRQRAPRIHNSSLLVHGMIRITPLRAGGLPRTIGKQTNDGNSPRYQADFDPSQAPFPSIHS